MKAKKILSLLLVLALSLAIFALPAAAEEAHNHDGCAAESIIMRRPPVYQVVCPRCDRLCDYQGVYQGAHRYVCGRCGWFTDLYY